MPMARFCPQCGGPCFPDEVQGLCTRCLRRMLLRLDSPDTRNESRKDNEPDQSAPIVRKGTIPIMVAAMLLAASSRGQVVADGATNTLSNVTNSIVGDVTVGTNGSLTLLIL